MAAKCVALPSIWAPEVVHVEADVVAVAVAFPSALLPASSFAGRTLFISWVRRVGGSGAAGGPRVRFAYSCACAPVVGIRTIQNQFRGFYSDFLRFCLF